MSGLKLVDVYCEKKAPEVLFALLKERPAKANISHRRMPSWAEHLKFIRSKPYKSWHLVADKDGNYVGGTYLSKADEIGIFLFKKYQKRGYGKEVIGALIKKHRSVKRFLANISPGNTESIAFFKKMDFRHIQNTYELRKRGSR